MDFLRFLDRSPSVFHAAREIIHRLKEAHFTPLKEGEKWALEPGKGYFVSRSDTLIAAFRLPQNRPLRATLLASHIDSPCLKLKPHPEQSHHEIGQFSTEVYGAPLLHTWLDRDLTLSGRVTFLRESALHSALIHLEDSPVIIPGLAIHLDRTIGEKGILVQKQDHLKPVFSLHPKEKLLEQTIRKQIPFDQLLSFDLFLTPFEKPSLIGFDREIIASYRLDNLTSAYSCLDALLQSKVQEDLLQIALFWDHEEIGSMSSTGADSLFGNQILERIALCLQMDREDHYRLKSQSICLSADLAHGFLPNYGDKFDLLNSPFLGKGVVLKFNANQKYATNSVTGAQLLYLAQKHKIPIQQFANRSDIPSGSTVGSIMAANLGIPTLDLGIAGWAMHSARETVAVADMNSLSSLLKHALEERFDLNG